MSRWTRFARLAVLVGVTWPAAGARAQGPPEKTKAAEAPVMPPATFNVRFAPPQEGELFVPQSGAKPVFPSPTILFDRAAAARGEANQAWRSALGATTAVNPQFAFVVRDPADETLGATLEPVGDVLRAQLNIPADRGLIVVTIQPEGAAHRTGLRGNDILLTLAEKPLAQPADLTKHLKAVGEHDIALTFLRAGQPQTLKVRPVYRVTLGPVTPETTEYYLGVAVTSLDDALRTQLMLSNRSGLVVSDVVKESPAEKAGIKVNDILLDLDGEPLDGQPTLSKLVNLRQDKPIHLKLLRGGKATMVAATPLRRPVQADSAHEGIRLWVMDQAVHTMNSNPPVSWNIQPTLTTTHSAALPVPRIEAIEKEIKALQKSLDEIRDLLKAEHAGARGKGEAHGGK
jgi:membrane-associated protease RseP (regulator of RpoE activity)